MTWLDRIGPRIHVVSQSRLTTGYVQPARRLYDHELVVFMEGEGECIVTFGRKRIAGRAGSFLIIPPDTVHAATVTPETDLSYYAVHFDWTCSNRPKPPGIAYLPKRIPAAQVHKPPRYVPRMPLWGPIEWKEEVREAMQRTLARWRSDNAVYQASCRMALLDALYFLLTPPSPRRVREDRALKLARAVRGLLNQTVAKNCSVRALLGTLGYSYEHLCRVFRGVYGVTPLEYLNGARIESAKQWLADPRYNIGQVARKAGFNSPHYFARVFRRNVGMAPRDFLRT